MSDFSFPIDSDNRDSLSSSLKSSSTSLSSVEDCSDDESCINRYTFYIYHSAEFNNNDDNNTSCVKSTFGSFMSSSTQALCEASKDDKPNPFLTPQPRETLIRKRVSCGGLICVVALNISYSHLVLTLR